MLLIRLLLNGCLLLIRYIKYVFYNIGRLISFDKPSDKSITESKFQEVILNTLMIIYPLRNCKYFLSNLGKGR